MPATGSETRGGGARRFRLPLGRATLRLRLTLLYGGCFLVAGAALLGITYALVANDTSVSSVPVPAHAVTLPSSLTRLLSLGAPPPSSAAQTPPEGLRSSHPVFRRRSGPVVIGAARPVPNFGPLITEIQETDRANLRTVRVLVRGKLVAQRRQALGALLTESGVALALMALVSVALGWLLAGRALRPLRAMNVRARQITEDNLHERLGIPARDDELGELAATFDGLLGRLERAFSAQRRFVANASHELRTPITLQRALVEVTLADPQAPAGELRHACERVLHASEQQERVIEALLVLARGHAGIERRERVDLAELAADLLAARDPEALGIDVHPALEPAIAAGDGALLERLLANLLDNAIVHNRSAGGGWIQLETGTSSRGALLRVANSGAEIAAGEIDDLFEPFRRGDGERTGDGLGLGLSIVQAIAVAHGASLSARGLPGGGLEVAVEFAPVDGPPDGGASNGSGEAAAASLRADAFSVHRA